MEVQMTYVRLEAQEMDPMLGKISEMGTKIVERRRWGNGAFLMMRMGIEVMIGQMNAPKAPIAVTWG